MPATLKFACEKCNADLTDRPRLVLSDDPTQREEFPDTLLFFCNKTCVVRWAVGVAKKISKTSETLEWPK